MNNLIVFILGTLFGILCMGVYLSYKFKTSGILIINEYIPEDEPYLFLELDESIEKVKRRSIVLLSVKSQK